MWTILVTIWKDQVSLITRPHCSPWEFLHYNNTTTFQSTGLHLNQFLACRIQWAAGACRHRAAPCGHRAIVPTEIGNRCGPGWWHDLETFLPNWPGIQQWIPLTKCQWHGTLIFPLSLAWTSRWIPHFHWGGVWCLLEEFWRNWMHYDGTTNDRITGDLRRLMCECVYFSHCVECFMYEPTMMGI